MKKRLKAHEHTQRPKKTRQKATEKGAEGKMYWETGLLGEENLEKWKERTNSLRRH